MISGEKEMGGVTGFISENGGDREQQMRPRELFDILPLEIETYNKRNASFNHFVYSQSFIRIEGNSR